MIDHDHSITFEVHDGGQPAPFIVGTKPFPREVKNPAYKAGL
jgi:hypothetical protein